MAVSVVKTAGRATVGVVVIAGKFEVMVARRVDVTVVAAGVETEVTVTGSSNYGKAQPRSS